MVASRGETLLILPLISPWIYLVWTIGILLEFYQVYEKHNSRQVSSPPFIQFSFLRLFA